MSSKGGTMTMAALALVLGAIGTMHVRASPDITLDPSRPDPAAVVRALVTGETSGAVCLLRLAPNGLVHGAAPCGLSPAFRRVKHWRRTGDCVCLLDEGRGLVLAFQAFGGGRFRAEGVEPETLLMRLLPETSMPLTP